MRPIERAKVTDNDPARGQRHVRGVMRVIISQEFWEMRVTRRSKEYYFSSCGIDKFWNHHLERWLRVVPSRV